VSFTPLPLYPRERAPGTHFIGGWSGRYGDVKVFDPTGTRTPASPGRPARSQSLYRLSYPGSPICVRTLFNDALSDPDYIV
jgi:hypothetical protein